MTDKKKPKASKEIKQKDQLAPTQRSRLTKTELEHIVKLALMKDSQIYGKSFHETKVYFESKGFSLSRSQFTALRTELKSAKNSKNWFSKEALFVIEEDHMLSVERIRELDAAIYKHLKSLTDKEKLTPQKLNLLERLTARFESLQKTKTQMFSATPLVQEMMEVHAQQQEESQAPPISAKREEKEITNG